MEVHCHPGISRNPGNAARGCLVSASASSAIAPKQHVQCLLCSTNHNVLHLKLSELPPARYHAEVVHSALAQPAGPGYPAMHAVAGCYGISMHRLNVGPLHTTWYGQRVKNHGWPRQKPADERQTARPQDAPYAACTTNASPPPVMPASSSHLFSLRLHHVSRPLPGSRRLRQRACS